MKQAILDLLRCPVCGAGMGSDADGRVCRCLGARTHCYDFSKSGYLNLAGAHAGDGDLKAAVKARRAFLDAGYYAALSDKIQGILAEIPSETVLDAGCGEGYYTNCMAAGRSVLGVDLSRDGIDLAAKRARSASIGTGFAVASLFELPILDGSLDVVVNIFAPCAEEEFLRVLRPGGHLLLVGAGENHLMGLKRVLYDNPYQNQSRADLPNKMEIVGKWNVKESILVRGTEMIEALFAMTPYYWRTSQKDHEKLKSLETLTTETDFDLFLFRKGASK